MEAQSPSKTIIWNFVIKNSLQTAVFGLLIILAINYWGWSFITEPQGFDWYRAYRPAALEMAVGHTPYSVTGFYNPPWILLPMIPLALLPERLGLAVLQILSIAGFGYAAFRFGAKPQTILLFLLTPQTMWDANMGNIDWMIAIGFILPPQIGLFFVMLKPQIGVSIALFWLIEAWHTARWREVFRVFSPIVAAFLISFVLYGLYFFHFQDAINKPWNLAASSWPLLIPVGLVLLYESIKGRERRKAILASPFLSPYVHSSSLAVAVLGLLPSQIKMNIAVLALWFIWIVRGPR